MPSIRNERLMAGRMRTWPFRLWHWRSPGALLCCKHAAGVSFYLHLTCRGRGFWSDQYDQSAPWLSQDPEALSPYLWIMFRQSWWLVGLATTHSLRWNLKHAAQSSWMAEPTKACSSVQEPFSYRLVYCETRKLCNESNGEWWSKYKSCSRPTRGQYRAVIDYLSFHEVFQK